jgi:hypothetical protein
MAGTNNFLQWNPTAANQENDSAYTSDTLRSGGAPTNAIFPSATANKLFFQTSTFVAAMAAAMAAKNYNVVDTNLTNLQTSLSNILTNADLTVSINSATPGTAKGYIKFPAGIYLQWATGTAVSADSTQTINYPISFPTTCWLVLTSCYLNTATNIAKAWGVQTWTTAHAVVQLLRRGDEGSFSVSPMVFAIGN